MVDGPSRELCVDDFSDLLPSALLADEAAKVAEVASYAVFQVAGPKLSGRYFLLEIWIGEHLADHVGHLSGLLLVIVLRYSSCQEPVVILGFVHDAVSKFVPKLVAFDSVKQRNLAAAFEHVIDDEMRCSKLPLDITINDAFEVENEADGWAKSDFHRLSPAPHGRLSGH
jgi:hypothetical protein